MTYERYVYDVIDPATGSLAYSSIFPQDAAARAGVLERKNGRPFRLGDRLIVCVDRRGEPMPEIE